MLDDNPQLPVARYEDVAVLSLASRDREAAGALISYELGRLAESGTRGAELLTTLRVYLAEAASPSRTGRRLGIHRNTVLQRLARIEELLDRPIDPTRVGLRVAVELAALHRDGEQS